MEMNNKDNLNQMLYLDVKTFLLDEHCKDNNVVWFRG